jgi:hypothetical protein
MVITDSKIGDAQQGKRKEAHVNTLTAVIADA